MDSSTASQECALLGCHQFADLRNLTAVQLQQRCSALLKNQNKNANDVFKLFLHVLPKYVDHSLLDELVYEELMDEMQKFIAVSDWIHYEMVCSIIAELGELLNYVRTADDNFKLLKRRNLVEGSLNILLDMYVYCKQRSCSSENQTTEESNAYSRLFQASQQLQSALFMLLLSDSICFNCNDQKNQLQLVELELLSNVLSRLSDIADVIMDFNIRCAAEVWKCLLKLSLESYKLCEFSPTAMKWIERAVSVLCSHIASDLLILQETTDDFGRMLKIVTFHAKVLLRLVTECDGRFFSGYESCLNTLIAVIKFEFAVVESTNAAAVKSSLINVFSEMLQTFANNYTFFEIFYTADNVDYLPICFKLIDILVGVKPMLIAQHLQINQSYNIFLMIAKLLELRSDIDDMYQEAVNRLSVLCIIVAKDFPELLINVEQILSNSFLSDNFSTALLALDVWSLWIQFLSIEQCQKYFQHWAHVCHGWGKNCIRPGAVFAQSLLRALYAVLPYDLRLKSVAMLPENQVETICIVLDSVSHKVRDSQSANNSAKTNTFCDAVSENFSNANCATNAAGKFPLVCDDNLCRTTNVDSKLVWTVIRRIQNDVQFLRTNIKLSCEQRQAINDIPFNFLENQHL